MKIFKNQEIYEVKKGDILISEPMMPDMNFSRTVILICDDTDDTHLGFVLNQVVEKAGLQEMVEDFKSFNKEVRVGGPVQKNYMQFVHRQHNLQDSKEVLPNLYWGGDFESMQEGIISGEYSINDFWFFIGYSGWEKGQLKEELEQNTWLVLDHNALELLQSDPEEMWKKALGYLGKEYAIMGKFPVDPRLN